MSTSSVSLSVNVRYDRLVQEFTKLRSQAKVLREGVLSERAKNEQITEDIKSRESQLRKLRNENESLEFRNEQLTRRVELLQLEADSQKAIHGKEKHHRHSKYEYGEDAMVSRTRLEVLEEELQNKLAQNEQLSTKIFELERVHAVEIGEMSSKLTTEIRRLEAQIEEANAKMEMMKKEQNSRFPRRPVEAVKPLIENRVQQQAKQNGTHQNGDNLDDVISQSSSPCASPPIGDSAVGLAAETTRAVLHGLSTVFHLLHQRTELYPFDSTMETLPLHVKQVGVELSTLSQLLSASVAVVDDLLTTEDVQLESHLDELIGTLIPVKNFEFPQKLLQRLSMEENKAQWCDGALERLNESCQKALVAVVDTMDAVVQAVIDKDMIAICERLEQAVPVVHDLERLWSERWARETRLPAATRRLHCVGQALEDALGRLKHDFEKLAARITAVVRIRQEDEQDAQRRSSSPAERMPLSVDVEPSTIENRKTTPTSELENPEKNHKVKGIYLEVSSQVTPKPKVSCEHCADKQQLEQEISYLRDRVLSLESEKEQLTVDVVLMKRRLEQAAGKENYDVSPEKDISHVHKDRIKAMLSVQQKVDSRARYYHRECEQLLRIARSARERAEDFETRLADSNRREMKLEDELMSVRKGYESQIVELSDHIADLNQKMISYQETPINNHRQSHHQQQQQQSGPAGRGLRGFFK